MNEKRQDNKPIVFEDYAIETSRGTFENWQLELPQLMWHVAGPAFLLFAGSPQSKEEEGKKGEKLDEILRLLDPKDSDEFIDKLDKKISQKILCA